MNGIAKRILPLAERVAAESGLAIYDVEYVKEGPHWFLRIYLDGESVGLDECERVSRALLSEKLPDEIIKGAYFLEVSSPGICRALTREEHFKRYMGECVLVKLRGKKLRGKLMDYCDGAVMLETPQGEVRVLQKDAKSITLDIDVSVKEE